MLYCALMATAKRRLSFTVSGEEQRWESLRVSPKELNLGITLHTGQTFLWKQTQPEVFTGVVASQLVSLKQTSQDTFYHVHNKVPPCSSHVRKVLEDFFTVNTSLESLWSSFKAAHPRFAAVAPYIQGARLLRQDPVECVFQFICSSNNHIQRITKMVDYLASLGSPLGLVHGHNFYAFPTLDQLAEVGEKQLRDAGFGYRAKYIVGAVEALRSKEGGGEKWLSSLRDLPLEEATAALCTLPGIGSKVAACVALYSLDKHQAIPVDTHVWRIAVEHFTPELAGQRLTSKMHSQVAEAFVSRFGDYAGWAHTVLFIAELSSYQKLLPPSLQTQRPSKSNKRQRKATLP